MQVDQAQLQTVLPAPGGHVRILKEPHKGSRATLEAIDMEKFSAEISLKSGERMWRDYEDISKIPSS